MELRGHVATDDSHATLSTACRLFVYKPDLELQPTSDPTSRRSRAQEGARP